MTDSSISDKELLEKIVSHTNSLNSTLQSTNPFALPSEAREVYQRLSDEVRVLAMDVRVALRNYDKLEAFYREHNMPTTELKLVGQ